MEYGTTNVKVALVSPFFAHGIEDEDPWTDGTNMVWSDADFPASAKFALSRPVSGRLLSDIESDPGYDPEHLPGQSESKFQFLSEALEQNPPSANDFSFAADPDRDDSYPGPFNVAVIVMSPDVQNIYDRGWSWWFEVVSSDSEATPCSEGLGYSHTAALMQIDAVNDSTILPIEERASLDERPTAYQTLKVMDSRFTNGYDTLPVGDLFDEPEFSDRIARLYDEFSVNLVVEWGSAYITQSGSSGCVGTRASADIEWEFNAPEVSVPILIGNGDYVPWSLYLSSHEDAKAAQDDANAKMEAYLDHLSTGGTAASYEGDLPATRPEATSNAYLEDDSLSAYQDWWTTYEALLDEAEASATDESLQEYYESSGTSLSFEDWLAQFSEQEPSVSGLKWFGQESFDLLNEWGPWGTLGVYTGVRASSSWEDVNWNLVLLVGAGVAAVALLNN